MYKAYQLLFLLVVSCGFAQQSSLLLVKKNLLRTSDTLILETSGIQKKEFQIKDSLGNTLDTAWYDLDFAKGTLIFRPSSPKQISVTYYKFPDFLTQKQSLLDTTLIVSNEAGIDRIYSFDQLKNNNDYKPFDGLETSGSIVRGLTVGNNQNAVVNSNLDLQITGQLSEKIGIRASIQDNNLALQNGAYSQRLDEFDQIYLEVFSDKWSLRGGDLFLENRNSQIFNFNKKVQGLATYFKLGEKEKTEVMLSGSLVRGQYARSSFVGSEGNQGPYKLIGNQGELFVLVISASERVYVNGALLQRGENNQYMIDYNAGEITFTTLFPITSEMRIEIEYQYTERNFNRLITYNKVKHQAEKWFIEANYYLESDNKNQPLQQNLSAEQIEVLKQAGNDPNQMFAVSAIEDTFSENKILYRKVNINGVEVFEFSTDPNQTLFQVRFTNVGNNLGNYVVTNNQAIGRIFEYVPPVNGVPQGSFEPIIRLVAPTKTQMIHLQGGYNPSEKTKVYWDLGVSEFDANLFSTLGNQDNTGAAGVLGFSQFFGKPTSLFKTSAEVQFVQQNFNPIERLFNIEFNRDWNVFAAQGNQSLVTINLEHQLKKDSSQHFNQTDYTFQKLDFSESYSGQKHQLKIRGLQKNLDYSSQTSLMKSKGQVSEASFLRSQNSLLSRKGKNWGQLRYQMEDIQETNIQTNKLSNLSQRFHEISPSIGRGDTTQVYWNIGFVARLNDSLRNNRLERVNNAYTYFLKSRIIQKNQTNLMLFVNYRQMNFTETNTKVTSLNSRILYQDTYLNDLFRQSLTIENSAGTLAQQEFTFVEVEPGLGVYTWIDYNNNGIQELQEFEVAPFPDQANYVKIFLPNQVFVPTQINRFSQSLDWNPQQWSGKTGLLKTLSKFYNQTSVLIERRVQRTENTFDLNPFATSEDNLLGKQYNFRNSLFFNRSRQQHTVVYTFNELLNRTLLSVGSQQNETTSHQLQYSHLVQKTWLMSFLTRTANQKLDTENFSLKAFNINSWSAQPKIGYVLGNNGNVELLYENLQKNNTIDLRETLKQQRLAVLFNYTGTKSMVFNAEFSYFDNRFTGDANSPVAFQMMEGLQDGKNLVWRTLIQKSLTNYLDLNLNYQGRKSETSQAIHTGSLQLRAFF